MQTDQALHLNISQSFPVSKQALYEAWTDPDQLKQWWRPMGKLLVQVENDIRQGGNVAYYFEDDLKITGTYKEVKEGDKLVYSWNWHMPEQNIHDGQFVLQITFNDEGNSSRLDVQQDNFKEEHAIKPHQMGWEEALKDLQTFLSKS